MSHFSHMSVEFKDAETLVSSLIELGIPREQIEVHRDGAQLKTYSGGKSSFRWNELRDARFKDGDKAHVVIRKEHVGQSCNDAGWWLEQKSAEKGREQETGSCAFVCDYGKRAKFTPEFQRKLTQEYTFKRTKSHYSKQGKTVQRVQDGETMRLYVRA